METTIKQAEGQKVSISFIDENSQCTVLLTPREFLFLVAQVLDYSDEHKKEIQKEVDSMVEEAGV